ncbi:hypothetical protein [Enterococcus sp. AZ196]|uniref:hypothetical protein n=1 Tax=Enterococcus sp. AZ196 TaxID=2774659 RepID=UPI003D28969E
MSLGTVDASAVETKSTPLTLPSNSSLLSVTSNEVDALPLNSSENALFEDYPFKRVSWFPLGNTGKRDDSESAEFYYKFKTDENGDIRFKLDITSLPLQESSHSAYIRSEFSYYIPHFDPEDDYYKYTSEDFIDKTSRIGFRNRDIGYTENAVPNAEGWVRLKITNISNSATQGLHLFKLGVVISHDDSGEITWDELKTYYNQ